MPLLFKIEPNGKSNTEENPAGSEKFIFVLDGNIEVKVASTKLEHKNSEIYSLKKNNSLYFDAAVKHHIQNIGKTTAKVLCVTTPPVI